MNFYRNITRGIKTRFELITIRNQLAFKYIVINIILLEIIGFELKNSEFYIHFYMRRPYLNRLKILVCIKFNEKCLKHLV